MSPAAAKLLAACLLALGACGDEPPPNLLVVTLDTTRADVLSCYGGDPRTTPSIDALAREGVLFENAFSTCNVTKPAHLSLFSGQPLIGHRVFNNEALIPRDVEVLPNLLRRKGYRTAAFVGAIQLGEHAGWRGFDVVQGPSKTFRRGQAILDDALAWLGAAPGEPFFLWTHFFDPHTLYKPPPELAERYYSGDPKAGDGSLIAEEPFLATWNYPLMSEWVAGLRDRTYAPAMYAAEVEYTDALVGRLIEHLETTGVLERTAIVLIADHGESLGEHGVYYDHAGLYQPSLHVPFIVRWPGIPGGRRVDSIVTQLDVLPTLADMLDFATPNAARGRSLRPLLEGQGDFEERELFVFEAAHNHQIAVRKGRWKAIWPVFESHRFFRKEPELYDLDADPGELHNVWSEHPEVVAELAPHAAPWRSLGTIEKGPLPEVSDELRRSLDALGYAEK